MATEFHRRHFMMTAAATMAVGGLHTTELWGKTIKHKPLDPVNPDILYGTTSSIWGGAGRAAKKLTKRPGRSSALRNSACRASNSTVTASSSIAPTPWSCKS